MVSNRRCRRDEMPVPPQREASGPTAREEPTHSNEDPVQPKANKHKVIKKIKGDERSTAIRCSLRFPPGAGGGEGEWLLKVLWGQTGKMGPWAVD